MANGRVITGYQNPMYGIRANGGAGGKTATALARGVDVSISVDTADDIIFYADNGAAETISGYVSSGEISLTCDQLKDQVYADLFGATATTGGGVIFSSTNTPAKATFGCIVRTMENGVNKWYCLVVPQVVFKVPEDAAATQEEDIDFQTITLEGTLYPDDGTAVSALSSDNHKGIWKVMSEEFDSESAAITALSTAINTYSGYMATTNE